MIFGASGNLTVRKLIPALYRLFLEGQMPESFFAWWVLPATYFDGNAYINVGDRLAHLRLWAG